MELIFFALARRNFITSVSKMKRDAPNTANGWSKCTHRMETTTEVVSRPHAENLIDWARDKPRVVVLSADLTSSCEVDTSRDTYPDRFFSMGMAEQNMMGFAAGLAREGFFPYIHP